MRCRVSGGFTAGGPNKLRELEVVIPAAEYANMAAGATYALRPLNGKGEFIWRVREGLTLSRR